MGRHRATPAVRSAAAPRARRLARERAAVRKLLRMLGPGLITGASDDDPSGIGTYAVAGASLGLATLSLDRTYLTTLVAILGTTISPYLFFWQSSQEVEEKKAEGRKTRHELRGATRAELRYSTIDVVLGMGASNAIMYFIILATAVTLSANGRRIETAADAAEALRPLAGNFAGLLFAAGMVGTGLLAIPILSASAAYAVSEAFGWREGLSEKWWRARPFYGVIVVATLAGMLMVFTGVRPMDALFWTAMLNGAVAPPLLVLIMLAARDPEVMGRQRVGPLLTGLGWAATAIMFLALAGLVYGALAT